MFDIANPWVLLLIPLPLLLRYFLPPGKPHKNGSLRIPFFYHLQSIKADNKKNQKIISEKTWIAFFAWILLVLAVAGPLWVGKPMPLQRSGRDILLAIDISGSMEIPDMRVNGRSFNRLDIVKNVAHEFIQKRAGDRLGLILFGTRAYLQSPLTFDLKTVQSILDDASIGLAGPQTALGDAVGLAIKQLKNYPKDSRVLILLTDGVNNAGHVFPLDAAKIAADYHIRIHTIGLGSDHMLVPGLLGPQMVNPSEELDENTLKQIADITHGVYFRATNHEDLEKIYKELDRLEPRMGDKEIFRPKIELYPWPLALSFLIAFFICLPYLKRK